MGQDVESSDGSGRSSLGSWFLLKVVECGGRVQTWSHIIEHMYLYVKGDILPLYVNEIRDVPVTSLRWRSQSEAASRLFAEALASA